MENPEIPKKKRKKVRHIFTSSVSFTGGDRLVSKNALQRRIWLILIILAILALIYHLSTVVEEYQGYSVNTVLKQYTFGFLFPDVTICAGLPFSKKKISENRVGVMQGKRFWNYAMQFDKTLLSQRLAFTKSMYSFNQFAYERDIYTSILDSIHYCSYLGKPCFRSNFKVQRHPLRLNCVTFSAPTHRIVIPDKEAGLHIILSSEESYALFDPLNELHITHGYEVIIHEPGTIAPVQKDTTSVGPGMQLNVKLKMKNYTKVSTPTNICLTRREIIKIFKRVFRKVVSQETIDALKFTGKYSEDDCLYLITQFFSIQKCSCLQDRIPFPWGIKFNISGCNNIPKEFFYNDAIDTNGILRYHNRTIDLKRNRTFDRIVKRGRCSLDLLDYTNNYDELRGEVDSCPKRCKGRIYTQHVSKNLWPASRKKVYQALKAYHTSRSRFTPNSSVSNFSLNLNYLSSILIYPSDLSVIETQESLAYPKSQLLADFGGNIGLWVGVSVLTIAEIIEFFIRVFAQKWSSRKRKKQLLSKATKKDEKSENVEMNEV